MTILFTKEERPPLHRKQDVDIDDLRYQVEAFMRGGGHIQTIPEGVCARDMAAKGNPQEGFVITRKQQ